MFQPTIYPIQTIGAGSLSVMAKPVSGEWIEDEFAGIAPLASELIQTSGINGGGLPWGNQFGESIELLSPNWPVYDLYFCSDHQSPLMEGATNRCCKIDSEHLRACGFSWCGHFLVSANSSDLTLWKKQTSNTPTAQASSSAP